MPNLTREQFGALVERERAAGGEDETIVVPLGARLLADHLTPVVAYRRLVAPDERTAPSFLLESVEGGERQGRYSILGAQPRLEVTAYENDVRMRDNTKKEFVADLTESVSGVDPLDVMRQFAAGFRLVKPPSPGARPLLPGCFLGGWVGFAGYDTVRYAEPQKLPFDAAPANDR